MALNGGTPQGQGVGSVWLQPTERLRAKADVIVSQRKPLGFDFIVGMNGGGDCGRQRTSGTVCAAKEADTKLEEPDFSVTFDHAKRHWTASRKWRKGVGPDVLRNVVWEYSPAKDASREYEQELQLYIDQGSLVPYDKRKHGPAKGLIPLMAVIQRSKNKVRPVMDF
ncbi:hypothetical protein M513_08798 [Trichuris suis]|uniref:Uncharacterized protein n=1 Tax=Trichuris suis TaxID=68888 RepID=A0A085LZA2_9BILA|nr:hypothetical protein M513_08798 [Trichuris suis]